MAILRSLITQGSAFRANPAHLVGHLPRLPLVRHAVKDMKASGCTFVIEAKGGNGRWSAHKVPKALQKEMGKKVVFQNDPDYLKVLSESMQRAGSRVKGSILVKQAGKHLAHSIAQGTCFYLGTRCMVTSEQKIIYERKVFHRCGCPVR